MLIKLKLIRRKKYFDASLIGPMPDDGIVEACKEVYGDDERVAKEMPKVFQF